MKQTLFLSVASTIKKTDLECHEKKLKNINIRHFLIEGNNKKTLNKEEGDYFTITFDDEQIMKEPKNQRIQNEVTKILQRFIKKYHKGGIFLIIGIGNQEILADSFGVNVTNEIIATNHYNDFLTIPKVAIFNPEMTEKTGISSYNLIQTVVNDLKPDMLIIVDSLATNHKEYLNNTIEINDTGIIPGEAMRNNKEISKKTFGIPVISIGGTFIYQNDNELYTKVSLKEDIKNISQIVSKSINHTFFS